MAADDALRHPDASPLPTTTGRFAFLSGLDESSVIELLEALERDDDVQELHRMVMLRHAELSPQPSPEVRREQSRSVVHSGDQLVDAQYGVAYDAACKCVGVYHRVSLIPPPAAVASRLTQDQREFFLERAEQGCVDQLLIVPQLDDRVVPLSMLLDGYTALRRSMPADPDAAVPTQRAVPVDEQQYVVEKGLWNRANFNQSHNPAYSSSGGIEPVWKVLVLLGDVLDPLDPSKSAHPSGELGLVHNLNDPRAMKRALEKEKEKLQLRRVNLAELSIAGYVIANTILSMIGEQTLDGAHNTATLFTHYQQLKREAGADLYPVVYTRNGRIYLDETPSTSRARVRPVGVRRVIEII